MTRPSFAKALRAARVQAGLSQIELAARVGLTGSYISQLEAGNRRPVIPRRIETLCKALGIASGPLQEAAAFERSSPTLRKRFERVERERVRLRAARDRILIGALRFLAQHGAEVAVRGGTSRLDPVLAESVGLLLERAAALNEGDSPAAAARALFAHVGGGTRDAVLAALPALLEDVLRAPPQREAPAPTGGEVPTAPERSSTCRPIRERLGGSGGSTGSLPVDPRAAIGAAAFWWRSGGDDGHPRVERGDFVLVDPTRPAVQGDVVAYEDGSRSGVRRLRMAGRELLLESFRAEMPPLELAKEAIVVVVLATYRRFG